MKRSIKVPAISNKIADIPPDEYSWRKYGQKPIKGSPHPRLVNSYMLSQWPRSMFKKSLGDRPYIRFSRKIFKKNCLVYD